MAGAGDVKRAQKTAKKAVAKATSLSGTLGLLFDDKGAKVGNTQAMLMIGTAIAIDTLQLFLLLFSGVGVIANRVVTAVAYVFFAAWFYINGISIISAETRIVSTVGPVLEFLPGVAAGPALTFNITMVIALDRLENTKKGRAKVGPEEKRRKKKGLTQAEANEINKNAPPGWGVLSEEQEQQMQEKQQKKNEERRAKRRYDHYYGKSNVQEEMKRKRAA